MHPEGHFPLYAYVLDLYRELPSPEIVDVVSYDAVHIGIHDLAEGVPGKPSVADERVAVAKVREDEFVASPGVFVGQGAESEGV